MQASPAAAPAPRPLATVLAVLALVTGVCAVSAGWILLNSRLGGVNGWVALVAAADAALLLRLAGMRPGRLRAALGVASVLATVAVVGWMGASIRVGLAMGLRPMESAWRMGPDLAWTLSGGAATPLDLLALAVALGLTWWWCR